MAEDKKVPLKVFSSNITVEWPEGQQIVLRRPTPTERAILQSEVFRITTTARRSADVQGEVKVRETAYAARAQMFDALFISAVGIAMEKPDGALVELTAETLAHFDPTLKAEIVQEHIESDSGLAGAIKK